jgi:hypothetical protein
MLSASAAAAVQLAGDSFSRSNGAIGSAESGQAWQIFGQNCGGCNPKFFVEGGAARIDPASRLPTVGHAVVDTNVSSGIRVEADIRLSPTYHRANTGLSALYKDKSNHLFCKIEVTDGRPSGLLSIGETQGGKITSLLASKTGLGLKNGSTYHLAIDVPADVASSSVACTVSSEQGSTIASVSYRLNSGDRSAYGAGDKQGLRTKVASDEDDTRSTWDNFVVSGEAGGSPPPPPPPPENSLVFGASADATIKPSSPTSNFGSSPKLEVDGQPTENALLKFEVSGVGQSEVARATLRVYNTNASDHGGDFFLAVSPWDESTVNWDSAPSADVFIASLGKVSTGSWYEVDVTSVVGGDGSFGFRVQSASSNGADYASKEAGSSTAPQLVIELAP